VLDILIVSVPSGSAANGAALAKAEGYGFLIGRAQPEEHAVAQREGRSELRSQSNLKEM
jgi:hypothetical protein